MLGGKRGQICANSSLRGRICANHSSVKTLVISVKTRVIRDRTLVISGRIPVISDRTLVECPLKRGNKEVRKGIRGKIEGRSGPRECRTPSAVHLEARTRQTRGLIREIRTRPIPGPTRAIRGSSGRKIIASSETKNRGSNPDFRAEGTVVPPWSGDQARTGARWTDSNAQKDGTLRTDFRGKIGVRIRRRCHLDLLLSSATTREASAARPVPSYALLSVLRA